MSVPTKILFIQHASEMSGSYKSLLLTIKGLKSKDANREIAVLCRKKEIRDWYIKENIQAYYFPFIGRLTHCTISLGWYNEIKQLILMPFFVLAQFILLRFHPYFSQFTIIHLNSSVLISSGIAAKLANRKIVWHIREIIAPGRFGFRKKLSTWPILKLANKIICISPLEESPFNSKNENKKIQIIYNFVDDYMFTPPQENILDELAYQLQIDRKINYIIIHLGGMNSVKGGLYLLEVWKKLKQLNINHLHLLWLGDDLEETYLTYYPGNIHNIGVSLDVKPYIYLSDMVYFGCTIAHFPRPIFEGFCAKKPSLAFNQKEMEKFVTNLEDGILINFDENNFQQTCDNLLNIFLTFCKELPPNKKLIDMGINGYNNKGLKFFKQENNIKQIEQVYNCI